MNPASKWISDFTQTIDSFIIVDDTQNQTIYDYVRENTINHNY